VGNKRRCGHACVVRVWLVCDGSRRRQGDGEPEIRGLRRWVRSERLLVEGIRHDGNNVSGAAARPRFWLCGPPERTASACAGSHGTVGMKWWRAKGSGSRRGLLGGGVSDSGARLMCTGVRSAWLRHGVAACSGSVASHDVAELGGQVMRAARRAWLRA